MSVPKMTWADFSARYCKTQVSTPDELAATLNAQKARYNPDGFFLAECHMFDSSKFGSVVILPYGPNNTFKTVADKAFSPRGLASDMSVAIGFIESNQVPA